MSDPQSDPIGALISPLLRVNSPPQLSRDGILQIRMLKIIVEEAKAFIDSVQDSHKKYNFSQRN